MSMIFVIYGAIDAVNSDSYGFPPLVGVGTGFLCVGNTVFIIAIVMVKIRQTTSYC
jgi:hypothetical protein